MTTKRKFAIKAGNLMVVAAISGTVAYYTAKHSTIPESEYSTSALPQVAPVLQTGFSAIAASPDFVDASASATPSVVYIKTGSASLRTTSFNDWFWGNFSNEPSTVFSTGSGVVLTTDGYIVTNNHVVERALSIEVVVNSRHTYKATLVGSDPSTDLAVLKIEAKGLTTIPIANSNEVKVGEWVLAVGNPFNLNSTVTAGIVSAKGRNINVVNSLFPVESFIQTDAAINPGNSGGALVNTKGELIGINTAILSKTGAYNGYGFAVPSNIVKKIVDDLTRYGAVQRAFFGANVTDITDNAGDESEDQGVELLDVMPDGGAAKAGLQKGDIVYSINNSAVNAKATFDELISYYRPGDKISVIYRREKKPKTAFVELTNSEGTTAKVKNNTTISEKLGASFEALTKVERETYRVTTGYRIKSIQSGSTVSRMGIPEGFIVTHINKEEIRSSERLISLLTTLSGSVLIEGVHENGARGYYSFQIRR